MSNRSRNARPPLINNKRYLLSSCTPRGCGHCMDSYSVLPKDALKIATLWPGWQTRLMTSFSQATLLLNSSEIAKPAFNKAAAYRGRRNCARAYRYLAKCTLFGERPRRLASFLDDRAEGEKMGRWEERRIEGNAPTLRRTLFTGRGGRTSVAAGWNKHCLLVSRYDT